MSSALERLQRELEATRRELEAAQHTLAAAEVLNVEHQAAVKEFEITCRKIEQAHQEWISALDVVGSPIFMHDRNFRILRCNQAYQRCAGIPFQQIIGQPYYAVFPKANAPLSGSLRAVEKTEVDEGCDVEEVPIGDKIYRSCVYAIPDAQGVDLRFVHTFEDITARKQAEAQLQESESFTKAVLDNLPIGVAVNSIEPSVAFSYMNDNFPLLYRTTREQLNVPDAFWDVVYEDPDFRQKLQQRVFDDYKRGDAERMIWADIPISRKGAETRYISARNVPMPDKKHTISMVWDVTEIKKAESARRESEEKFRALVESTSDWIWEVDQSGRYTYVSPRVEVLLGYSPQEVLGKSPFDFMLPAEVQRVASLFRVPIDKREPIVDLENTCRCKDGSLKTLETSGLPFFDEKGEFAGYRGIDRDITERKHAHSMLIASHALLHTVVENIPVRIFWKDTQLCYLGCNTLFAHDAGLSTPDELIGKDDFQMGWRDQAELYRADDQKIIDSGMPKVGYEEPQTTPDGRTIWLRTSKVPLRSADDSVFGMLGIYEDITERRQVEEGLKLFRALLDNSSDAIEVVDPATLRFLDVNETECRALGYSRDELLSMGVTDIDPFFTPNIEKTIVAQMQQTGTSRVEGVHRRKDGSTFPVEVSSKFIELDKPYVLNVVRDITERKQAQQVLKDEKAFSDTLVQSLPDIFYLLDRSGGLLRWNTKLLELLGLSAEEMATVNVLTYVHEDNRVEVAEKLQEAFDVGSASVEARLLLTNGVRDYLLTATRIETQLGMNVVGIGVDITERKRAENKLLDSESRLHAIFESVRDGIMLADIETRKVFSGNSAICQMMGYSLDELMQLSVSDVHPEQDLPYVFEQFDKQARGEVRLATDMPIKRKDG
ncbi:MAG TPA: PAS domain S-box protein [Halothiobacillus sp.]|nr:PAS domain S-box protein [Halothiobacillus sp.]